ISPERSITAASAVGPSSHGVENIKWSFAETAANPDSRATSTTACSRPSDWPSSPNSISGRWMPSSIIAILPNHIRGPNGAPSRDLLSSRRQNLSAVGDELAPRGAEGREDAGHKFFVPPLEPDVA